MVIVPDEGIDRSVKLAMWGEHPVSSLTLKLGVGGGITLIIDDLVSVSDPVLSVTVREIE